MTFIGPLEDRIAIRELYDTYADAATRRDEAAWFSCWAEEAIWCIGLGEFRGRDAIVTQGILMMKSIHGLKGADTCLFLNFPGSIELTGPLGNGHAYTFELIVDEIGRTSRLNRYI
jgi:hypothetical protein